jgi:hypothetical protein
LVFLSLNSFRLKKSTYKMQYLLSLVLYLALLAQVTADNHEDGSWSYFWGSVDEGSGSGWSYEALSTTNSWMSGGHSMMMSGGHSMMMSGGHSMWMSGGYSAEREWSTAGSWAGSADVGSWAGSADVGSWDHQGSGSMGETWSAAYGSWSSSSSPPAAGSPTHAPTRAPTAAPTRPVTTVDTKFHVETAFKGMSVSSWNANKDDYDRAFKAGLSSKLNIIESYFGAVEISDITSSRRRLQDYVGTKASVDITIPAGELELTGANTPEKKAAAVTTALADSAAILTAFKIEVVNRVGSDAALANVTVTATAEILSGGSPTASPTLAPAEEEMDNTGLILGIVLPLVCIIIAACGYHYKQMQKNVAPVSADAAANMRSVIPLPA